MENHEATCHYALQKIVGSLRTFFLLYQNKCRYVKEIYIHLVIYRIVESAEFHKKRSIFKDQTRERLLVYGEINHNYFVYI